MNNKKCYRCGAKLGTADISGLCAACRCSRTITTKAKPVNVPCIGIGQLMICPKANRGWICVHCLYKKQHEWSSACNHHGENCPSCIPYEQYLEAHDQRVRREFAEKVIATMPYLQWTGDDPIERILAEECIAHIRAMAEGKKCHDL